MPSLAHMALNKPFNVPGPSLNLKHRATQVCMTSGSKRGRHTAGTAISFGYLSLGHTVGISALASEGLGDVCALRGSG